jgi:hypothetical protein
MNHAMTHSQGTHAPPMQKERNHRLHRLCGLERGRDVDVMA